MSATEDETQQLDAGWDDVEPSEPATSQPALSVNDVDEAWDSVAPSVSAATPSQPPLTDEVDGGWDDAPDPIERGGAPAAQGKRRPHRQRRTKSGGTVSAASSVLRPRPAENSKKQQREHQRKLRAQEALIKEQRKAERKAARAAEVQAELEERRRRIEAEQQARRARADARDRARGERPASTPRPAKPARAKGVTPAKSAPDDLRSEKPQVVGASQKKAVPWAIVLALLIALGAAAILLTRS